MIFIKMIFCVLLILSSSAAQDFNNTVIDEKTDKPMMIGYTTREAFSDSNFAWWFNSGYELYEFDSSVVNELEGKLDSVDIIIIMGSWCSDSRRDIPAFFRILDALKYPSEKLTMISVDRDKKSDEGNIDELAIELVPTIIFYKHNSELGRIEEMPEETLEKDMLKILTRDGSGEL